MISYRFLFTIQEMTMLNESQWHPDCTGNGKYHYDNGIGLLTGDDGRHARNVEDARHELELSISYGDRKAKRMIAIVILNYGPHDEINIIKAVTHLSELYDLGDEESECLIKKCLKHVDPSQITNLGVMIGEQGYSKSSLLILHDAYKHGLQDAAIHIARLYRDIHEMQNAFTWYEIALSNSSTTASEYAEYLMNVLPTRLVDQKAIFKPAIDDGGPERYFIHGVILQAEGNIDDASELLKKSIDEGSKKGKIFLEELANQGYGSAQYYYSQLLDDDYCLGYLYMASKNGFYPAFAQLLNLGRQGNKEACYYIGQFYGSSTTIPDYDSYAIKWYEKSGDIGEKEKKIIERIRNTNQICPYCHKSLVVKRGRNGGFFLGCPNYPDCRYTDYTIKNRYAITRSDVDNFEIYTRSKNSDPFNTYPIIPKSCRIARKCYNSSNFTYPTQVQNNSAPFEFKNIFGDGFER